MTGASGWLAGELDRRLAAFPGEYSLDRVSVRGEEWLSSDWSGYDGVFHFASVVYGDDPERVNADLTRSVARKCVINNVPWMLLMSSFGIYGADKNPDILVDEDTVPDPVTPYGRSKLASEEAAIGILGISNTRLSIVRAPLIYGPKQKNGSFISLMKLSRIIPVFPETNNMRSMIFSQNLCELCRLLADSGSEGVFLPQDGVYHNTADLIRGLAVRQGARIRIVPGAARITHSLCRLTPKFGKLFGNARYRMDASDFTENYRVFEIEQALDSTVRGCLG